MANTTGHISSLLASLDPAVRRIGIRRDDVVAGNWVIADEIWPVYFAFKSDVGKEVSTNFNIIFINQ